MRGALVLAALLPVLGACGQQAAASSAGQQTAQAPSTPCGVAGAWKSDGSGGEFLDDTLTISPDCMTAAGTNSVGPNTYTVSREDSAAFFDLRRQDGARFVATLFGPYHLQVREIHGLTDLGPVSMFTTASSAVAAPSINFAEPASPTDSHGNPAPGSHAFCTAALRAAGNGAALRRLTGRDPKHGVDWGIWSDADSLATDYENAGLFRKDNDLKGLQENLDADTKSLRGDCATNGQ